MGREMAMGTTAGWDRARGRVMAIGAVVCVLLASVALMATGPEACAQSGTAKPPGWTGKAPAISHQPSGLEKSRTADAAEDRDGAGGLPAEVVRILEEAQRSGLDVWIDVQDHGTITTTESGSGTGAGLHAEGDRLVTDWDGSAPSVLGPGGRAVSGGGAKSASRGIATFAPDGSTSLPLLIAGIVLVVGAGAGAWFLRSVKFGMVFGGIGGVLIAVGLYPAIALWGVLLAVAVCAVYALRSDAVANRFRETTRALTAAIDHPLVDDDARKAVAGTLAMEADARDKQVIAAVRAKDAGLAFAGTT